MAKTLRYAEFGPNNGTRAIALQWFARELNKRSHGSLEIEFYWGKSLLSTNAVLQGISDRAADMGSVIAHMTPRQLRSYNIGDMPVGSSDVWVGMRAMYSLATTHPAIKREFEDAGVAYVTNFSTGPVQLICTRKISSLSELRGARLRGSGSYGKIFADLGARVQQIPQPDIYQALDSGLLECNQNYYYSMKAYRQYEVARYVLELNWGQNMAFGIVMNRDVFTALTVKERKAVQETGSVFIDYFAQLLMETNGQDKTSMTEGIGGVSIKISSLPDGEKAILSDAGVKYVNKWVSDATAEGKDGKDILSVYRSQSKTFTEELETAGYPWRR